MLEPGNFLYVPRGWYHVALPMNEATLHVTIGTRAPSGPKAAARIAGAAVPGAVELKPRPSFALPSSASPDGLPPAATDRLLVEWHGPSPQIEQSDGHALTVRSLDRTYRFPNSMRSVIASLADRGPHSIESIRNAAGGALDTDAVRTLVSMLLQHGLVSIAE
jgi:hypothetical protein